MHSHTTKSVNQIQDEEKLQVEFIIHKALFYCIIENDYR